MPNASRLAAILFALALLAAPPIAGAQIEEGEAAAYTALHLTPVAGLAPVAPNLGRQAISLRGHYARHRFFDTGTNGFAIGVDLPLAPRHSAGLTLGRWDVGLEDTDAHFMFAGNFAGNIFGLWAEPATAPSVSLTYDVQLGYAQSAQVDMIAFSAGFPIAFPIRGETISFVPFVTPALGWGRMSFAGQHDSAVRFHAAGGGALELASGIGFHAGARYVFVENADLLWGVGVTWRPR